MYVNYKDDESKFAVKNADVSEFVDGFRNAGYILTDNDLIVDIDNMPKKAITAMIERFNINTQTVWTDRGAHLYFKKPVGFRGAQGVAPIGFPVEWKHIKNTKDITIKRRGVLRTTDNEGVREELPFILSNDRRKLEDMTGLDEGDGRNDKLFKHKMKMNNHPDTNKILNFINDYVFAEPMDQSEFETVSREQSITTDDKLTPHDVALQVAHVTKPVEFAGGIYYRDDNNNYIYNDKEYKKTIFKISANKDPRFIDNVFKTIELMTEDITDDAEFPVKFNNGVLQDGDFTDVEYKEFTPFVIDTSYNEDATPVQIVDDYLNHLTDNDPEYRQLVEEILGYTLVTSAEQIKLLAKFFIFIGDGGNGKGTLLEIIRSILGAKNISSLSIKNLANDKYFPSLKGKLANLGDDIEDEPINNERMKVLKNISTADTVSMRKLYAEAEDVQIKTTLIFTSNSILKSFEKGESFQRRIMWLPMFSKPKAKDSHFISKITSDESLEYWVKLMVEGYMRLYENGKFTEPQMIKQYNQQYHRENNNVLLYVEDMKDIDFLGLSQKEAYEKYEVWCDEEDEKPMTRKRFKDTLKQILGVEVQQKKVNGVNQRRFVRVEDIKTA